MLIGLFGCGGFGREVMPLLRATARGYSDCTYVFVETDLLALAPVNGVQVISEDRFVSLSMKNKYFNVAIGSSEVRQAIAARMELHGVKPLSIVSESACIYDNNEIGAGAIICAGSIITSNAQIGRYFHCNLQSYVAHDVQIGDFVTFAPRVSCNGHVHILDHAYIGTGAIIKQGGASPITIGQQAVIGMGAVVLGDVPDGETWVGNPARPLLRQK